MSVIAVTNGKGGVGKTTLTAELAAFSAQAGYRVLIVDLDPQCNMTENLLSTAPPPSRPGGVPLAGALLGYGPPTIRATSRKNIDLLPGDPVMGTWSVQSGLIRQQGRNPDTLVRDMLGPIAGGYELVVFDCPPLIKEINVMGMVASDWVLSPVKADTNSIDGLRTTADWFTAAREINPYVRFLGVALCDITQRATAIIREVRAEIERDLGDGMVFDTTVRHSERAAWDTRQRGMFYGEYAVASAAQEPFYKRLGTDPDGPSSQRFASKESAEGVAGDWERLTVEVLTRMNEREAAQPEIAAITAAGR